MIEIKSSKDQTRLRRLALSSQGLLQPKPYGQGLAGARKAISHLGYIQIDTISVVERAHNHVLRSRVPNFTPDMTNQLLTSGDVFEYWSHAAAFLPIEDYRFSLPYKQAIKSGQVHWYKDRDLKLMNELLARIRADGPLRSRDLETTKVKREGWWDWKPAKQAIEQLYMQGDLMVSDREGFQKAYDLTERVLPSNTNTQVPTVEAFAEYLLDQQLRCHGLVTYKGVTYLRKNVPLRKAVKALVTERLAQGLLEELQLSTGEQYFVEAGALERPLPRVSNRMMILSPFDNCVIQRDRLKALFQYEYLIECYVPAAKRQYGYFSLPLLYRDQFIGRVDCKAHRKDRHFEIKALYFEAHGFDDDEVISAFVKAMGEFCSFQNCDTVSLAKASPKLLTEPLQRALESVVISK